MDALGVKALNALDMDAMVEPLKNLLEQCGSLEEYRDRILEVYADQDASAVGDLMQQALTLADLAGRYDARKR